MNEQALEEFRNGPAAGGVDVEEAGIDESEMSAEPEEFVVPTDGAE